MSYTDPTLAISSPFYNEQRATNGILDIVTTHIAGVGNGETSNFGIVDKKEQYAIAKVASLENRHLCSCCSTRSTGAYLPKDGIYRCSECVAEHSDTHYARHFPVGTFRCCPTSQEEGSSAVVRCVTCQSWYHLDCLAIHEKALRNYLKLSTTRWHCPEPNCCRKALKRALKKRTHDI